MTPLVKICGLRDRATLAAALDAGADMVGFVFYEPSPRHLPLAHARLLSDVVDGRARKVALTVDADDATLASVIETLAPDLLQLHGAETPERVRSIRLRFGVPVMKALAIASAVDLRQIELFDAVSDYLLFDARAPLGASHPGGNGRSFDWTLLKGCEPRRPWLLAGGLDRGNVAEAVRTSGAPGVDVSSGVESAPGVKSAAKIADFIAALRAGDRPANADCS